MRKGSENMRVSKMIKPLEVSCKSGDLVQYVDNICLVVRTDVTASWGQGYGLVCLTGFDAGNVIVSGVSLEHINNLIVSILVKSDEVYISRKEEE